MNYVNDYNMQVNGYYYPINNTELFFNNIRTGGKSYVANFFNNRQDIKNLACYRLNQSEKGKEKETAIKFIRDEFLGLIIPFYSIFNLSNLPKDVEDILVSQTLVSCGYYRLGDFLRILGVLSIAGAVIGVLGTAIWLKNQPIN